MQALWNHQRMRQVRLTFALLLAVSLGVIASLPAHATSITFQQVNLVSNIPGLALRTDADLVNPWGISHSGTSSFWVSDRGWPH